MRTPLALRIGATALVAAFALAAGPACMKHGNDIARTPVSVRSEPRWDLRALAVYESLAADTGGESFRLASADLEELKKVIDTAAGSFELLDLVFVIDTTHSMKTPLTDLRAITGDVLDHFWTKGSDGHVAVVAYRDVGEVYESRVVTDFSDKKAHVSASIRGLQADGGGDVAEHAFSGLMLAAKSLAWRPAARKVVILLSDAPPHEGGDDGGSRDAFVEHARANALSVYPVTFASYKTGGVESAIAVKSDDVHGDKPHGDMKKPGDHHAHTDFEFVDYDEEALEDLSKVVHAGGGHMTLSPCGEELPGVLRGVLHHAALRAGGKPLDLVLVLDTTGSMGTAAVGARLGADSAFNDFMDKHLDVNLGLVLYRDEGDDYVTRVEADLSSDLDKALDALWDVKTGGGGDLPEALDKAVLAAADLSWRSGTSKAVVVITDAPSHGGTDRDKAVEVLHSKGVAIDVVVVGYNPYDGPFEDEGDVGSIGPDDFGDDDEPVDTDDLDAVVGLFPDGDVMEPDTMDAFKADMRDIFTEIHDSASSATSVEVAFVIDATGSMGSALDGLARAHDAFHEFMEGGGRVGVVSYRDKGDDYIARREADFTSDPHVVLRAFGKIDASGGGDLPEAIYYGLEEASKLSWTPGTKRYLILVTDDVAHRYEDKKKLVADWAKSSKATLFAFSTRFGWGDDGVDDWEPPTPDYEIDAISKLYDTTTKRVTKAEDFDAVMEKLMDDTVSSLKKKEILEMVFVVDTTGSMGGALDHLAKNRAWYEKVLKAKTKHRIGMVVYRDEGDDYVTRVATKLTSSVDDLMKDMGRELSASGGGDLPEALFDGMKAAMEMEWGKKSKKVIVVVTDADAHDHEEARKATVEWAKKSKTTVHIIHADFWE